MPDEIEQLKQRIAVLERMDIEAATHVEGELALRTAFNGNPPYVGWKGLGLALKEALNDRDRYKRTLEKIRDARNVSVGVLRGIAAEALDATSRGDEPK